MTDFKITCRMFALLLYNTTEPLRIIAEKLDIQVYGVGAGDRVDGQLVILHDLIGLFWEFKSKFVKRYCEAGQLIQTHWKIINQKLKVVCFHLNRKFL